MDHIGGVSANSNKEAPSLPPGFRFHPTDEELVSFYLANKIQNPNFSDHAIAEADLNKCEPWELPGKARMGEKEWYFYSLKDRKYPTGVRTNRATHAGYWKATGKDREVMGSQAPLKGKLVGMKKTLVFYQGRAPKGTKSNWVMHEYRAEDALKHSLKCKSSKDEWVLCRVFHKTPGGKKMTLTDLQIAMALIGGNSSNNADARIEKMAVTLPALREVQWNTPTTQASISYMSGQNVPSNTLGQGQACSYLTGQNLPSNTLGQGQARSYLSGQGTGQGVYGQSVYATGQTSQNQLANLLSSLPETGNSVFKSLFHYNEQVNSVKGGRREDCQVPVMEELEVVERRPPANLQVPVSMWEELQVGGQNVKPMLTCGRPSPDSCISTLECAPSSHLLNNYMPSSDLESFWLY